MTDWIRKNISTLEYIIEHLRRDDGTTPAQSEKLMEIKNKIGANLFPKQRDLELLQAELCEFCKKENLCTCKTGLSNMNVCELVRRDA